MTTIRINADILRHRERRLRQLSLDLIGAVHSNFNAGDVDAAYDKLHNKWKESQNEINFGLERVANLLRDISNAFESLEEQLVGALPPSQAPKAHR